MSILTRSTTSRATRCGCALTASTPRATTRSSCVTSPKAPARGRPARRRKIPARGAPARVLRRILLPRRGLSGQRILLPCGLQGVGRRRTPALLGGGGCSTTRATSSTPCAHAMRVSAAWSSRPVPDGATWPSSPTGRDVCTASNSPMPRTIPSCCASTPPTRPS